MQVREYTDRGYIFKQYFGRWQKLKYDSKKDDYYVTYNRERFYLNNCFRQELFSSDSVDRNKNIVGNWQEGYCVYLLQCKDDVQYFDVDSKVRVIYCPPGN